MKLNLYVHYDSVSSHVMTRGINFLPSDFESKYVPNNLIVEDVPSGLGRFDVRTNFKLLRGKQEVLEYLNYCEKEKIRVSNWIDFESVTMMHQLTPNEIAEILYLFHAQQALRSGFFYKLQNNYVYLTLSNGLVKTYYRYVQHFNPRFKRVMEEQMTTMLNEGKSFFFSKKEEAAKMPEEIVENLLGLFARGLKVDITQAFFDADQWVIPLFVIEDELTLLTINQSREEQVGFLAYHVKDKKWKVDLPNG